MRLESFYHPLDSPGGVHYPGLHPGPGGQPPVAPGDQGLLLEGGDGAPRLAQAAHAAHTLLQPEHDHWSQDLREKTVRQAGYSPGDMIAMGPSLFLGEIYNKIGI